MLSKITAFARIQYTLRTARKILSSNGFTISHPLTFEDAGVIIDIFRKRVYAPGFPFYRDSVIVDCGAHRGFFSIFALLYAGKDSTVISLEPMEQNYNTMLANLEANSLRAHTVQAGLSADGGKRTLHLSSSVNHSIVQEVQGIHKQKNREMQIDTLTLKQLMERCFVEKIDFLKMDCEGAEYEVLFSTEEETFARITTIALEFHDIKHQDASISLLVVWLMKMGYTVISYKFEPYVLSVHTGTLTVTRTP